MFKLFRKRRGFFANRNSKKRHTVATEFTRQRKMSVKYQVSKARFRLSRFTKILAAFSFLLAIVVAAVIFLFFSTFFSVQHIELVRKDFRADMEKISPITEPFRGKNIFFVSKSHIKNDLHKNFPQVESIEIEKVLPRTIRISIATFPIAARWEVNIKKDPDKIEDIDEDTNFAVQKVYINKVGQMSDGTDQDSGVFLIEEQGVRESMFQLGDQVITGEYLNTMQKCKGLLENTLGNGIVSVKYFRDAKEAHFISEKGTAFWIDLSFDTEKQISKMKHVILETDILNGEVEYFDLRIEKRIFWKPKITQ